MKKIVIDARESGTSTGRYVDKLIEYLYQLQPPYKFTIITKPSRVEYLKKIAPKYTIIETPIKEFTFSEQTRYLKLLNDLHSDLIHFAIVQQPILYGGKTVTTMHDLTTVRFRNPAKNWLLFTLKQYVYKWVNKIVARKSKIVITPTEFVKDDVAKFAHINSRKIEVTHEAADLLADAAEPVDGLSDSDQFIMYVGRPNPHKNLNRLIDAFVMLKTTHPDLKLVLAGKRDILYKRIARSVEAASLSGVIFTDFVSDGQLRWLYEHCQAYVFPSLSEGFGLPAVEAMLHGAPVVSSNTTSLPEILGDAAEYFDPTEAFDMASAIARVLDNPKLASKLREIGHEQAKKYSWKRMAEQTVAVYKDVLGE